MKTQTNLCVECGKRIAERPYQNLQVSCCSVACAASKFQKSSFVCKPFKKTGAKAETEKIRAARRH